MIVRFLLWAAIGYFAWSLLKRWTQGPKKVEKKERKAIDDILEKDPISGVHVPRSEALVEKIGDQEYYFASQETRDEFLRSRR